MIFFKINEINLKIFTHIYIIPNLHNFLISMNAKYDE